MWQLLYPVTDCHFLGTGNLDQEKECEKIRRSSSLDHQPMAVVNPEYKARCSFDYLVDPKNGRAVGSEVRPSNGLLL
jgi:hypothetical protein